jgi:uncharacterized protein with HEPN domain
VRDDRERLLDVRDAIERIERHASRGRQPFEADELIQIWMVHHLQIIGEACRALSAEIRDRHPEVPWRQIIGMRNVVVHDYFRVDVEAVWSAVANDLPRLKAQVDAILTELRP